MINKFLKYFILGIIVNKYSSYWRNVLKRLFSVLLGLKDIEVSEIWFSYLEIFSLEDGFYSKCIIRGKGSIWDIFIWITIGYYVFWVDKVLR